MYYSYVMGTDNSIYELKENGFSVEQDGESNYMISFEKDKADVWEEFISRHLSVGFWNEYLTDNGAVFIFNLENGLKRYAIENCENDEVLKLCEKICNCKFGSIKAMLEGNHFYKDKIK